MFICFCLSFILSTLSLVPSNWTSCFNSCPSAICSLQGSLSDPLMWIRSRPSPGLFKPFSCCPSPLEESPHPSCGLLWPGTCLPAWPHVLSLSLAHCSPVTLAVLPLPHQACFCDGASLQCSALNACLAASFPSFWSQLWCLLRETFPDIPPPTPSLVFPLSHSL